MRVRPNLFLMVPKHCKHRRVRVRIQPKLWKSCSIWHRRKDMIQKGWIEVIWKRLLSGYEPCPTRNQLDVVTYIPLLILAPAVIHLRAMGTCYRKVLQDNVNLLPIMRTIIISSMYNNSRILSMYNNSRIRSIIISHQSNHFLQMK